jgi:LysR family nod box-dependent transcriptional activator
MPPTPMPKMEQTMQWHKYLTNDPGLVWLRGLHDAARQMDAEHAPLFATSLTMPAIS